MERAQQVQTLDVLPSLWPTLRRLSWSRRPWPRRRSSTCATTPPKYADRSSARGGGCPLSLNDLTMRSSVVDRTMPAVTPRNMYAGKR